MTRFHTRAALVAAAVITLAPFAARAQSTRPYVVDRTHSEINFIAPSRLLDAHGTFDKWTADVQADPANIERSSVRLTIDPASINTRITRRDDHLRSPDFFDVAKYPQITFVSKSVRKSSDSSATIIGDLTMHGVTKQIAVPVTMAFNDGSRGRFTGAFPLNRKEWGVNGNSTVNPVEDVIKVEFTINITAPQQQGTR